MDHEGVDEAKVVSPTLEAIYRDLCNLGLDPKAVEEHAQTLMASVQSGKKPTFEIIDTCRLDNGGMAKPRVSPPIDEGARGFAAMVPAAGAASRYSQPLFPIILALEAKNKEALAAAAQSLRLVGAKAWPLPLGISRIVNDPGAVRRLSDSDFALMLEEVQQPKALMPCVKEGLSFLGMKHFEHEQLHGLQGQVFITPPGQKHAFADALNFAIGDSAPEAKPLKTEFLEQGPALSTIRFHKDGRPFIEPSGSLSPVPAGHGALAQLFPEVRRLTGAHSVFIRNVDNVVGTERRAQEATFAFLATHRHILNMVQKIRAELRKNSLNGAADYARDLAAMFDPTNAPHTDLPVSLTKEEAHLWLLAIGLFHVPIGANLPWSLERLTRLFDRPVTTLGQVPNTGNDVGGTPCFIRGEGLQGDTAKVSIEVPHVSASDKQAFLANPQKATHFNPVFCAVELTDDPLYYKRQNRAFWLMSEKTYRGEPVMYFETVLYELIGNSDLANCVLLEVPRLVFNPHKALQDAAGRSKSDWLCT